MIQFSLSEQVLDNGHADFVRRRKPAWLRAKLPGGKGYQETRSLVDRYQLHTVCESAKCPNMGECWARGTATMMILGDVCTRSCGFCHIKTGRPPQYDLDEPRRVGEAAALMRLKHLVMTSVNRDELPDGGAEIWAETIREIRRQSPGTQIEVLIPDFCGDWDALQLVLDERPEILNHNMETVRRLYGVVRPQARYERSIELLHRAKMQGLTVKTGIMVGIGEEDHEVEQLMRDVVEGTQVSGIRRDDPATNRDPMAIPDPDRVLDRPASQSTDPARAIKASLRPHASSCWHHHQPEPAPPADPRRAAVSYPQATYPGIHEACDILTIGQYLQPTRQHLPITRWVTPDQFAAYRTLGEAIGFRHVESGPLVRSSYHADNQVLQMQQRPALAGGEL